MILLAAIPDLLTAAAFWLVWTQTEQFGPKWVATGVTTMLLEFFVVHASGFFTVIMVDDSPRTKRVQYLAGLASLYLLLIAAFAWGLHAWWMVGAFCWLSLGKMLTTWNAPAVKGYQQSFDRSMVAMAAWALSVLVYLGAVIVSSEMDLPAYGVTPEVTTAAGFNVHSGGIWEATPYRALADGAMYFGTMGVLRTLLRLLLLLRKKDMAAVI
jgi:hypothetical protein